MVAAFLGLFDLSESFGYIPDFGINHQGPTNDYLSFAPVKRGDHGPLGGDGTDYLCKMYNDLNKGRSTVQGSEIWSILIRFLGF